MKIFPSPSDKDLILSLQDRLLAGGNGWLIHLPISFPEYKRVYPRTAHQLSLDKKNQIIYSDFLSSVFSGDSIFSRKLNYLEEELKKLSKKFSLNWINIFYDVSPKLSAAFDEKNYVVQSSDYQHMLINDLNKNLPDIVFVYGKSPHLESFVIKLISYNDYPLYFSINI